MLVEADLDLFDAAICEGVEEGSCVLLQDGHIVFVGGIKRCPDASGCLLLLHAVDFDLLKNHVAKRLN